MKRILILLLIIYIPSYGFAQAKKFSVSLPIFSVPFGGPRASLYSEMERQGFNDTNTESLFGVFRTEYPTRENKARILIRAAYRIKNQGSIYIVGGIAQKGTIEGFKQTGVSTTIWSTSYTEGIFKEVEFSLYQFGGGYEYTAPRSYIKLAAAASAFFYNYSLTGEGASPESAIIPGLNLNMRMPFGKVKSFAGLEFLIDFNLAPAVQMKEIQNNSTTFKTTRKTTMTHGSVGLALSLRAK